MTVRTRFAPSPTGYLHIGGARTALFCWLYARRRRGQFVLRIEDTDRERSTKKAIDAILESMQWLGLDADEGPHYQSQRLDRYQAVAQRLLKGGHAYHCYCSKDELEAMRAEQLARGEKPRYDRRCRNRSEPRAGVEPVVRFANPLEGEVQVEDVLRGRVTFANEELDDLVLLRSDGVPTYNFSVVVDDWDMKITHVIRGDDHLNNTPRQINIYHALGAEPPIYAHVPMILGPDGAKLSKRHGAVSVMEYRNEGYLPEALINYLVRLGWSHGDQEIFSVKEMIELFDLVEVNKAASRLNPEKLTWLNQHYIKVGDPARLAAELAWHLEKLGVTPGGGPPLEAVVQAQQERAKTMVEMAQASEFFYREVHAYHDKAARKNLTPAAVEPLQRVRTRLAALNDWQRERLHEVVNEVADALGLKLGKVAQPIRVAVSGGPVSPPIDATLELLGRECSLARIDRALAYIAETSGQGSPRPGS